MSNTGIMESESNAQGPLVPAEALERTAHDLRGAVGVTLGGLDGLERALSQTDEAAREKLFAMARRGARRIERIADRLSRAAELQSGAATAHPTRADARDLVSRAIEDAKQLENRAAIQVSLNVVEKACIATFDLDWISFAIRELVGNAIRMARHSVTVDVSHEGEFIRVAVSDDHRLWQGQSSSEGVRHPHDLGAGLVTEIAVRHGIGFMYEPNPGAGDEDSRGVMAVLRLPACQ